MAIQPVKRTRAYEEIVRQLAEMVQKGELQPGDRLPSERELAAAFGVGRPTLRQALTVMAEAGVVEVLPGSGVYLRNPVGGTTEAAGNASAMVLLTETKNLRQILELRIGIEAEAAYLAAQRRTPEHVERLKQAFDKVDTAFAFRTISDEDYQFHSAIAAATGNPVFVRVMTLLADLFMKQFYVSTTKALQEPERLAATRQEHGAILEAILSQQPELARKAMILHLKNVSDRLERIEKGEL